jgi:hypothetical protein
MRLRETKGLARHFREANAAGVKKYRRWKDKPLPYNGPRCPDCGSPSDPHLCTKQIPRNR